MVELIVVMVLIGILGAIGAARFFNRTGFDAAGYAEQLRGMARYAQKVAIAQNTNVYVVGAANAVALCYANSFPCPSASQVQTPAGSNSGNGATRAVCVVGSTYAASWYCEGVPTGVSMAVSSSNASTFFFNGLGKPYLPADLSGATNGVLGDSTFTGLAMTISGDGSTSTITVEQETGYVH